VLDSAVTLQNEENSKTGRKKKEKEPNAVDTDGQPVWLLLAGWFPSSVVLL
jgi:hypothetical protein